MQKYKVTTELESPSMRVFFKRFFGICKRDESVIELEQDHFKKGDVVLTLSGRVKVVRKIGKGCKRK